MDIGGYRFSEPREIFATANIDGGVVYVVLTHNGLYWYYLYVGQTGDLAERFDKHEKWNSWLRHQKNGELHFSFLPIPNRVKRLNVETELRNKLSGLPCNLQ